MQFRLILCLVLSWRGLSLINYFIDSNRPQHTIFKLIYVCNGAYNKGTLNVIINLWKKKCNEFWLSRHNFILLFCFLYGLLQTHQLVSIITFSDPTYPKKCFVMQFRLILCLVLSWRGLSLINYFIDSNRPQHTIFKLIYVCNGAYNKGTLNVIINLWKKKCNEFWLSRHNFILLFCFLYGLLPTHQLVSIITFSIYFGRTCTYTMSLSHSRLLAITYARFEWMVIS